MARNNHGVALVRLFYTPALTDAEGNDVAPQDALPLEVDCGGRTLVFQPPGGTWKKAKDGRKLVTTTTESGKTKKVWRFESHWEREKAGPNPANYLDLHPGEADWVLDQRNAMIVRGQLRDSIEIHGETMGELGRAKADLARLREQQTAERAELEALKKERRKEQAGARKAAEG